jgi:hypothetical protein
MSVRKHPRITFKQVDPPHGISVTGQFTDQPVQPQASGGWSTVQRARATSMTEWVGHDPIAQDVSVMFDGFADNTSVEQKCRLLYRLMLTRVGSRNEPPVITCTSKDIPLPFAGSQWVISAIAPGDEIRRERDGHRVRASFTVSLVEYVPGDVIVHKKNSPAKTHQQKQARQGNSGDTRTYIVKSGDTLQKIAAHELHKQSRWHDIAKLNDISGSTNLKVGRHLKIPKS